MFSSSRLSKSSGLLRFLFVSNTSRVDRPYLDPAARYRCFNPASDLTEIGHLADVVSFAHFSLSMVDNYDIFVFHKPPNSNILEATLDLIKKRGKKAIADYDDLIFNEKNALSSSLFLTGRASEKIVIDIFRKNHKALMMFDHVTVSTAPLAEQAILSNKKAKVSVIHNGLNRNWIQLANKKFNAPRAEGLISYFCGTKSHDHDFKIVEDTLADILHQNSKLTLRVVGPLQFETEKFPKRQLMLVKAVPYEELPKYIMQSYINIAPLESNTFNDCKSGLKFFEAGIFGVPSIASPIPDIARFKPSGIELPETAKAWRGSFDRLLSMSSDEHEAFRLATKKYTEDECLSFAQTLELLKLVGS